MLTGALTTAGCFFAGLLAGYAIGRENARCAYIRGWCAGARVTIQDLLDFTGVPDALEAKNGKRDA